MPRQVGLVEYLWLKGKYLLSKIQPTSPSSTYRTHTPTPNYRSHNERSNYKIKKSIYINNKKMGETVGEDHVFIVNGKKLEPGTPAYERAMKQFNLSMDKFDDDMRKFDRDMKQMSRDMENMFK